VAAGVLLSKTLILVVASPYSAGSAGMVTGAVGVETITVCLGALEPQWSAEIRQCKARLAAAPAAANEVAQASRTTTSRRRDAKFHLPGRGIPSRLC